MNEPGHRRRLRAVDRLSNGRIQIQHHDVIDFGSNDYLGLAADPRVSAAVREYLENHAWGAGASPLISGYSPAAAELEHELGCFEGGKAVLLVNSGYAGNVGVLAAVLAVEDVVFVEKRSHASLIDGGRLSKARLRVYRGDRLDDLRRRLAQEQSRRQRWIVTDSVFSMDGDVAPLGDLCQLAAEFDARLYVDEAHATGVLGTTGRGAAEAAGVEDRISIRLGTLSKALGSVGGFVVTTPADREDLIQRCRSLIYSTALPPAAAVASLTALRLLQAEPERRQRLWSLTRQFLDRCERLDIETRPSVTPIVPIYVPDVAAAVMLSQRLFDAGFYVPAIRPPTVPANRVRLRVSISAAHTPEQVDQLAQVLADHRSLLAPSAQST